MKIDTIGKRLGGKKDGISRRAIRPHLESLRELSKRIHKKTGTISEDEMIWIIKLLARGWPWKHVLKLFKKAKAGLDDAELHFYSGDHIHLFGAIGMCRQYASFPLPDWITFEVQRGYGQYLSFDAATLDEAFVFAPRKGHLKPKRFAFKNAWNIYQRCEKLHEEGWKLEDPLFFVPLHLPVEFFDLCLAD